MNVGQYRPTRVNLQTFQSSKLDCMKHLLILHVKRTKNHFTN